MCPQSVALGVSPVNRLCGCSFADAGSIPQFVGRPVQSLEELRWLHVQGLDDFFDVDKRNIAFTALNPSHVAAVYPSLISKRFLGQASCFAVPTHCATKRNEHRRPLFCWGTYSGHP